MLMEDPDAMAMTVRAAIPVLSDASASSSFEKGVMDSATVSVDGGPAFVDGESIFSTAGSPQNNSESNSETHVSRNKFEGHDSNSLKVC